MSAKVSLVPGSARQTEPRERVFRGRLRADREGKRARPTRRKRLREGREATASERRAPGNRSGERRSTASQHRVAGSPATTGGEATDSSDRGSTPTATSARRFGGATAFGTGNRVSVNGARVASRVRPERDSTPFRSLGQPSRRGGGHRLRFAGVALRGSEPGSPGDRATNGHRPPSLRARRAM